MISVVERNAAASYGPISLLGIRGEPWLLQYSAHAGAAATSSSRTNSATRRTLRTPVVLAHADERFHGVGGRVGLKPAAFRAMRQFTHAHGRNERYGAADGPPAGVADGVPR